MNQMLILLEQLHIQDELNELKKATIDRVVVNKDNSYVFYISSTRIYH